MLHRHLLLLLLVLCDRRLFIPQVQRRIDGCCKQLLATLSDHRAACQAFDAAVVWQVPGSGAGSPVKQQQQQQRHRRTASMESSGSMGGRGSRNSWSGGVAAGAAAAAVLRPRFRTAPTQDPWCTEGKLVAEQQALKRWQVRAHAQARAVMGFGQPVRLFRSRTMTLGRRRERSKPSSKLETETAAKHSIALCFCL
jgi:hypothetical protein